MLFSVLSISHITIDSVLTLLHDANFILKGSIFVIRLYILDSDPFILFLLCRVLLHGIAAIMDRGFELENWFILDSF